MEASFFEGRIVDARLELPFDQYQRYEVAAALLQGFGLPPGARVLEVGGGPGPLESFLPEYELFVSDIAGEHEGRYLIASGAALPFDDETFDAVVTLDTLEHVPAEFRKAFLAELLRVSGDLVVLSAPFADKDLELAEEALNQFIRARFQGDFPTLDEHAMHGLPELGPTEAALGQSGFTTATLPSGYLPRWLAAMLVHHEMLATGVPYLPRLHAYYNATVSPLDRREPSYRHVVVSARNRSSTEVRRVVDGLRSAGEDDAGRVALTTMAGTILTHRMNAVTRNDILGRELDQVRELVAARERELADRDAHVMQLERRVADMQVERAAAQAAAELEAQRRWMLGIPYGLRRLRAKVMHRHKEASPE
jgi:hypothetical protein